MPVKSQIRSKVPLGVSEREDDLGRARVADIQRARMVAAMIHVVSERGRASATVAHVVSRSGVSRRTFYEVFDDFEACFLAALEHSLVRAREYVLDGYKPAEDWRPRVRTALVGLLEFLEDEPAMGRLCVVETLGAGPKVHDLRTRTIDALVAVVDEGRGESKTAVALPALTAEGIVGGVLSVLHTRLLPSSSDTARGSDAAARRGASQQRPAERSGELLQLTGALMGMIVLPYLGPAAAAREGARKIPTRRVRERGGGGDPLRGLEMRLTYRTVRVLLSIAELGESGSAPSNRQVGESAGIDDQGQISKLLSRLEKLGLIENHGGGRVRGAPNAWALTEKGAEVEQLVGRGPGTPTAAAPARP